MRTNGAFVNMHLRAERESAMETRSTCSFENVKSLYIALALVLLFTCTSESIPSVIAQRA